MRNAHIVSSHESATLAACAPAAAVGNMTSAYAECAQFAPVPLSMFGFMAHGSFSPGLTCVVVLEHCRRYERGPASANPQAR